MKAAHIHIRYPEKNILFTFHTRSLYDIIKKHITRFYRQFKEEDPNWDNLHLRHGWGGARLAGVYSDACRENGVLPLQFTQARDKVHPFDYVCKELISNANVSPAYDFILIDEAQDFPPNFFGLCFHLARGDRDEKSIVWAYDELQTRISQMTL